MSSLPPRQNGASSASHLAQGASTLNRAAKRDPQLYPLALVVGGIFCVAGYFFMSKASEPDPAKKLMKGQPINPWDDVSKHDVHPSQVAAFKYRYKNREGVLMDAPPALNNDVRKLAANINPKYKTA